ncbi:histidine phosphatase family protein [Sulfitobacter sp. F26204]|uniref:histidine phosphatase family protein n=1 Tax=Sulfitobacter sp. F26204 TaxID=2996014 RepID=UPI00225DF4A1|nr:histidine phosphatase family protein [Sulfitobacter sp. F26204]MCX7559995.1 histidine phosphatase family protein [Sulfitobacter sp. F26204]
MTNYPRIWFLRHGQTEWNKVYRLQGQLDSPLTAQGVADAHRQAGLMGPILALSPDIYVSPLGRTIATADIALGGAPYRCDDRLMEIHAGKWQGRTRAEIMAEHPNWAKENPPALEIYQMAEGGEGLSGLQARVVSFLKDLAGPTVIVAHGLWGQVMRAEVCGLDMKRAGHLSNDQGCVYLLENGHETKLEPLE